MNVLKLQTDQTSRFKWTQQKLILQELTLSYKKVVLGIQIPLPKSVCKAMLFKSVGIIFAFPDWFSKI